MVTVTSTQRCRTSSSLTLMYIWTRFNPIRGNACLSLFCTSCPYPRFPVLFHVKIQRGHRSRLGLPIGTGRDLKTTYKTESHWPKTLSHTGAAAWSTEITSDEVSRVKEKNILKEYQCKNRQQRIRWDAQRAKQLIYPACLWLYWLQKSRKKQWNVNSMRTHRKSYVFSWPKSLYAQNRSTRLTCPVR